MAAVTFKTDFGRWDGTSLAIWPARLARRARSKPALRLRRQLRVHSVRLTPLLVLAGPPALDGTDQRIRSTRERTPTFGAVALDTRVQFPVGGSTFGVHAFPVPIAPAPRRFTMAFPAAGRAAEMHPPAASELLERKPRGASRTPLLRDRLNAGH